MKYIDVKSMADSILDDVAAKMKTVGHPKSLLILHAGDDPASAAYMRGKIKDCERCGIPVQSIDCKDEQILRYNLCMANLNQSIGGIIVQLPLPAGWDESVVDLVDPAKDVDGFVHGSRFHPCTPEGIIHIMRKELGDNLAGQDVLLIGKGKLVGRPLIQMLLDEGCTLTICHSRTADLRDTIRCTHPNVIISATGHPGIVSLTDCGTARLVIDAGISHVGKRLSGDCNAFDPDLFHWMHVTPVPGGVGLMTRAVLMEHMMEVQ